MEKKNYIKLNEVGVKNAKVKFSLSEKQENGLIDKSDVKDKLIGNNQNNDKIKNYTVSFSNHTRASSEGKTLEPALNRMAIVHHGYFKLLIGVNRCRQIDRQHI